MKIKLLVFWMAFLQAACASVTVPYVAPIPPHAIPVGINDAWHRVLTPAEFAADCPAMIRTPQPSGMALQAFLDATPVGCPVLALVEGPDVALVEAFARLKPDAIELGNELELPPHELSPSKYGEWIQSAAFTLLDADYKGSVILGGVYALTNETKAAIRWGLLACANVGILCKVGVHLYDASDADLAWLRALRWPVWVTEVGFPTRCDPARLPQQADYLEHQIARFSTVPMIERVFWYQRPAGPTCSDLDTFGLGAPAAELLHRWWIR